MKDVQSEKDNRGIPITNVGVCDYKIPLVINGQKTLGDVKLGVSLDEYHKGIHMSRLCLLLNSFSNVNNLSIIGILNSACDVMDSVCSQIIIKTSIYYEKQAPISGISSMLFYDICIDAQKEHDEIVTRHTLSVPITTLCPCSKAISRYGAHNQRSIVKVTLQDIDIVEYKTIINLIEKEVASSELFEVLKRPDEKAVTERAYENPKFVEDVARDALICLQDRYSTKVVDIEAINHESIHNHNVFAYIKKDNT